MKRKCLVMEYNKLECRYSYRGDKYFLLDFIAMQEFDNTTNIKYNRCYAVLEHVEERTLMIEPIENIKMID